MCVRHLPVDMGHGSRDGSTERVPDSLTVVLPSTYFYAQSFEISLSGLVISIMSLSILALCITVHGGRLHVLTAVVFTPCYSAKCVFYLIPASVTRFVTPCCLHDPSSDLTVLTPYRTESQYQACS